jgi:hypothetical protein
MTIITFDLESVIEEANYYVSYLFHIYVLNSYSTHEGKWLLNHICISM